MNRRLVFCGALAALLTVSAITYGQGEGRFRTYSMAGRGMTVAFLLRAETVQKEIGVTQEQAAELRELLTSRRRGSGNFREMSEEEREAAIADYAQAAEKQQERIAEILDDKQEKRLEELRIQAMGPYALMDDKITKLLEVTDEQKQQMTKAREAVLQKMRKAMSEGSYPSREAMRTMRDDFGTAMKEILTETQTAEYEAMKGAPFDIAQLRRSYGARRRGD